MDAASRKSIIAGNLARIRAELAQAAEGREITLVCVTKYATLDDASLLIEAGATDIAENLLPQAADRFAELQARGLSFTRHLIGPQQSRKLKQIPGNFDLFQALDRDKAVRVLHQQLEEEQTELDVLMQVNIGREEQKSGYTPDSAEEAALRIIEEAPRLRLRGLMAIPPVRSEYADEAEFENETTRLFRQMRGLFDRIRQQSSAEPHFNTLSQGMSQDYILAVREGATMVRIGSALFDGLEG